VATPGLRPVAMPPLPEEGAAKIIPSGELSQLSASALQAQSSPSAQGTSFQGFLGDMIADVSAKQAAAGDAMKEVMTGGNIPLHQAMIAVQEASVSFQLMVEVRNKLLESYQELMRMQV
jgi:flagellar hook-basal body complex protein FliE